MTSLKTMDRMDFIMKNKECINCGSTKFHQVENDWKCDYCGTLYLTPKKNTVPPSNKEQSGTQKIEGGSYWVWCLQSSSLLHH